MLRQQTKIVFLEDYFDKLSLSDRKGWQVSLIKNLWTGHFTRVVSGPETSSLTEFLANILILYFCYCITWNKFGKRPNKYSAV